MTETLLVPKLRFAEFTGAWHALKMSDVFDNSRQKGHESLPIYSVSQSHGLIPREQLDRNIANDAKASTNLAVEEGDLVYNMMRMWQGAFGLAREKSMVSPAYIVLNPKLNHLSLFYKYLFQKNRSHYLFWAYSYGLTNDRLRLYFKDFAQIGFLTPALEEQKKIASFLSAVDKKIQLLEQKKTLLEQYKKGVMQKLFSQEIRFKPDGGGEFPEWDECRIDELFISKKGKGLSKDVVKKEGKRPCILYGELYTYYDEVINNIKSYTDESGGVTSKSGDILIPTSTTTSGIDLANASSLSKEGVLLGGDIMILRARRPVDSSYFAYYFTHHKKRQLASRAQGTTIVHLYYNLISNLIIEVPSFEEQNKISDFIMQLDHKIRFVNSQIKEISNFKKGLLQQMFV